APGVTEASTLVSSIQNQASCAFTDTGLTATTAYYYRVFVNDTGALSSGSNEVSATTASPPPPPPSVANLSVAATPTSLVADNAAQSTITATLTDVNNQPVADHAVDFTTTAGTLSAASATSNAQGNASVTLKSAAEGTANVTATSSGLTGTCSVTLTAPPPPPATVSVAVTPTLITADGVTTGTVTANVTVGGQPAPDGTTVTFTTTWGSFQGADPATPQSLQATTVNGVASVVLVSSNTMPANSSFTVTASALSQQATTTPQAQQVQQPPVPPLSLVVEWYPGEMSGSRACATNGDTIAGCATIHFYAIPAVLGGEPVAVQAIRISDDSNHLKQQRLWLASRNEIIQHTYNTTDNPPTSPCPPHLAQGQTLYDFMPNEAWSTDNFHLGTYSVGVTYTVGSAVPNNPPNPPTPPQPQFTSITVNLKNLTIEVLQDADHPRLLKWYDSQSPSNTTKIAFSLESGNSIPVTATVSIYALDRPKDGPPIRTYTVQTTSSPTSQTVSADWDGKLNGGQDAPTGLYAFDVNADWGTGACPHAHDRKTSEHLTIDPAIDAQGNQITEAEYGGYDDNGTPDDESDDNQIYYIKHYRLREVAQPIDDDNPQTEEYERDGVANEDPTEDANNDGIPDHVDNDQDGLVDEDPIDYRPPENASEGKITLYDPDLEQVWESSIATLPCTEHNNATDGLTTSTAGKQHSLKLLIPVNLMEKTGDYHFVVSAKDSDETYEKGHRDKWAVEAGPIFTVQQPAVTVLALEDPMIIRFDPIGIVPSTLKLMFQGQDVTSKAQIVTDREIRLPWPTYPTEQPDDTHRFSLRVEAWSKGAAKVVAQVKPIDFSPQSDDPEDRDVKLRYLLLKPAHVRVKVFALADDGSAPQLIRTFEEDKGAGEQESVWNGTEDDGLPTSQERDYQCDVSEVLPDGIERLVVSIDPEAQVRLGGTRHVKEPTFLDGVFRIRVYVPTGGTLKVKLWQGDPAYTLDIFRYEAGKDTVVPHTFGGTADGTYYVEVEVGGNDPANPAKPGWYCAHLYRNNGEVKDFTVGATFVQMGRCSKVPWAGWYWPYGDALNPNLYDAGGPYDKYDQYVQAKTATNPGLRSDEAASHTILPGALNYSWTGHCDAWAAAAIVESEPRQPRTKEGINFGVGDLKGLLTGIHFGEGPLIQGQQWLGPRYDDNPGDDPFDPPPYEFQNFIAKWIRGSGRAVVMDMDPLKEVWSHPLWKYEAKMVARSRDKMTVDVTCGLHYVAEPTNPIDPNYLMNDPPESDRYVEMKSLDYWLHYNQSYWPDGGAWKPRVPGVAENPDFLWVPNIPRYSNECQDGLDPGRVDEILSP
ncbi:MAG: Ig-like domain-containing protein, partial [Armatimonadetes bacterium]|nr:Ig-like domain-containing protein [Armatimonadota bacterium]